MNKENRGLFSGGFFLGFQRLVLQHKKNAFAYLLLICALLFLFKLYQQQIDAMKVHEESHQGSLPPLDKAQELNEREKMLNEWEKRLKDEVEKLKTRGIDIELPSLKSNAPQATLPIDVEKQAAVKEVKGNLTYS